MPVPSHSPSPTRSTVPRPRALAAAVLLAAAGALPAAAQELKVAVINTEQVLLESATGKAALAELRQLREAKEAEGEALSKEVDDLRKRPSTSEVIDWIAALRRGGVSAERIERDLPFLGVLLKHERDHDHVDRLLRSGNVAMGAGRRDPNPGGH